MTDNPTQWDTLPFDKMTKEQQQEQSDFLSLLFMKTYTMIDAVSTATGRTKRDILESYVERGMNDHHLWKISRSYLDLSDPTRKIKKEETFRKVFFYKHDAEDHLRELGEENQGWMIEEEEWDIFDRDYS